jgi:hypothetical protein
MSKFSGALSAAVALLTVPLAAQDSAPPAITPVIPGVSAPPMTAVDLVTLPRLGAPSVNATGTLAVYSVTITDASGRTLSGQTPEAFYHSIRHANPFSVGINCALGGRAMRPYLEALSRIAECRVTCYPNAGLPNAFGGYDESPEEMAAVLGEFARAGLVNLVGGCCGSTPDLIGAIAASVRGVAPRTIPSLPRALRLSGLEPLTVIATN